MQLITRSSNKTLYLALAIAFVVHFIITLFARFDYIEPAINILSSPPPLSITLHQDKQPAAEVVAEVKAEANKVEMEAQRTQATRPQQAVTEPQQRDYLAVENWQLGYNLDTTKLIVQLFEPKADKTLYLELSAKASGISDLSLAIERPCIDTVKLHAFKDCPQDRLHVADKTATEYQAPQLMSGLVPVKVEVTDYQLEKWSQLAGIPLFDVNFY
jgi:hypothetical protein